MFGFDHRDQGHLPLHLLCSIRFRGVVVQIMPYPTRDEVLDLLRERRHNELIEQHILAGTPFVFRDAPSDYQDFANTLSAGLKTPVADISVIGSGRVGFSLDPEKFGSPFNSKSDVDVVVVNAEMFDTAWFQLYNLGRRRFALKRRVLERYKEHRANNVFFGFIVPDELPGVLTLSPLWFRVLLQVGSRIRLLADHKVNGRLYRTWDHVRAHQRYSLEEIKAKHVR